MSFIDSFEISEDVDLIFFFNEFISFFLERVAEGDFQYRRLQIEIAYWSELPTLKLLNYINIFPMPNLSFKDCASFKLTGE